MADPRETLPLPPTPDWTNGQILIGWGAILNALAYLAAVFAMGMWMGEKIPMVMAIAGAGFTFLSYGWQLATCPHWLRVLFHLGSNGLGIAAGLVLLAKVIA